MKTITIHFTSSTKFLPIGCWVIKSYMHTSYSHVAFEFATNRGKELVYEAVGVGVRYISKAIWLENVKIQESYIITMSDDQYNQLMDFCIDHAGVKYGYLQNIGIFVADLLKLKKNPFDMKEEVCSEILGEILIQLGYVFNKTADLLTPKDIEVELKKGDPKSRPVVI